MKKIFELSVSSKMYVFGIEPMNSEPSSKDVSFIKFSTEVYIFYGHTTTILRI